MTSSLSLEDLYRAGKVDELREILRDSSGPSEEDLNETVILAFSSDQSALAVMLMSHGAVLTRWSFLEACASKNVANFQVLLQHGLDINFRDFGELVLWYVMQLEFAET
ncbi:hypothetical protein N7478_002823 [Penicillium angulare]|uniref:uncharacterized protein n=1 Tax=Penicillium angulare TaxID=116970 RepID=UPI002541C893|nr:uncharacterized protein N7478_002823 [Penicillium angulare]KAJ5287137.1 hypothetical protein N7478_002823 [Penicillium angulare]